MQEIGEVEMEDDDVEEEVYNTQGQDKSEQFERFITKLNEGGDEANGESKGFLFYSTFHT